MTDFPEHIYLCNFANSVDLTGLSDYELALRNCNLMFLINNKLIDDVFGSGFETIPKIDPKEMLATSIAFLLTFVQENFTGPNLTDDIIALIKEKWPKNLSAIEKLTVDSESLHQNVKMPEFLLTSKILFEHLLQNNPDSLILKWWRMRLIYIHQKVLEEQTNSLYEEFKKLATELIELKDSLENIELRCLLLTEIAQSYTLFSRTQKAEHILQQASDLIGLQTNITGSLGVRTKYQQKPLPQLCLKLELSSKDKLPTSLYTNASTNLPKLLKMDDDVRLEKIEFITPDDNVQTHVPSVVQAILLAKAKILVKCQPKGTLSDDEIMPYLMYLLYQDNGPLSIRHTTLLFKIKQETNHIRTVDRSLKQCEAILSQIDGDKYELYERFSYLFSAFVETRYDIQRQCADLMISLGLIKAALDLFLKMNLWEDIVYCYTQLELRHLSAEILRKEIKKKPTTKLYCLLGDATGEELWYEKAWELSNCSSSLAKRYWGNFYYEKSEYGKCIPHYEKSLEINSLQERLWLRLGYSAISIENWNLAAQSYIKHTHLDPYNFESWNNLANALIKLGDKKRAHKILTEALKCNYNNWKVWENFMLVSIDTGNFEDVLNSYNRLIELKQKYLDKEIINILANAILNDTMDSQGRSSARLHKKCVTLVGHLCVQYSNDVDLWEISAKLSQKSLHRAQKLQKAYRAYAQSNPSWYYTPDYCLKVLQICNDLCEQSIQAIKDHDEAERSSAISQLSSARLTAQACIDVIEKNLMEKTDQIENSLKNLKQKLDEIIKQNN